jgi:uncharacterized lipoprotein YddW (UPF0748 family)
MPPYARITAAGLCAIALGLAGCRVAKSHAASPPPETPPRATVQPAPAFPATPVPRFPEELITAPASQAPGELRGVWLHDPRGVNWAMVMRELRGAGLNAIFVKFSTAGAAYYSSRVLPSSTLAGRDEPALCLAAARQYGIQVHAWHVCFQMKDAPVEAQRRVIRENRVQRSATGSIYRPSYNVPMFCPAHDANRQLEKRAVVELATKYPFDGVQLDHVRWSDAGRCCCETCRRRFARDTGARISAWPRDVDKGGVLAARFEAWRESIITSLVQDITAAIRSARRSARISAAVFADLNKVRRDKGQNWKTWVDRGWLDFICPMNYTTDAAKFVQMESAIRAQVNGRVPVYAGIGAYMLSSSAQLRQQIALARQYGASGWVLFNYDEKFRAKFLPYLKL